MSKKPVLYLSLTSPPCRAVLLTAAELGVELDLRLMNLTEGEHKTPEFLKLNPQHTIPLLDDNGSIVSDSHVICGYLVDKYGKDDTLYPKEMNARNEVLVRLFFESGHIFSRLRFIVEPVFYFGAAHVDPDKYDYLARVYGALENYLAKNTYLCGSKMTIADLSCLSSVSSAHKLIAIDGKKYPKLLAWLHRLETLPYYKKCNGEGLDLLVKRFADKLEENRKAA